MSKNFSNETKRDFYPQLNPCYVISFEYCFCMAANTMELPCFWPAHSPGDWGYSTTKTDHKKQFPGSRAFPVHFGEIQAGNHAVLRRNRHRGHSNQSNLPVSDLSAG
jgi:hypothetical protein